MGVCKTFISIFVIKFNYLNKYFIIVIFILPSCLHTVLEKWRRVFNFRESITAIHIFLPKGM